MNVRERYLAWSLGVMMGLVVVFVVGYQFVYVPLSTAAKDVETAQKELTTKKNELGDEEIKIKHAEELSPRLAVWELATLPESDPTITQGEFIKATQVAYEKKLAQIFMDAGFKNTKTLIQDADLKGGVNQKAAEKDKTPLFYNIKFNVSGSTNLEGLLKGFENFYEAKYLHQIRGFMVKKASTTARRGSTGGDLDVSIDVDAFIVLGSDKRAAEKVADKLKEERTPIPVADKLAKDLLSTAKKLAKEQLGDDSRARELLSTKKMLDTLKNFGNATTLLATNKVADELGSITPLAIEKMLPPLPSVLAPDRGGLVDSLKNNIFLGPTGSTGGLGKGSEKPEEVLPFVKFTSYQQVGMKRTIHLADQSRREQEAEGKKAAGYKEIPLWIGGISSNTNFDVVDRFENVLNHCTVVDIQKRLFFFYCNHKIYRMEIGQSVSDGLQQPVPQVNMILGPLATVAPPKDSD